MVTVGSRVVPAATRTRRRGSTAAAHRCRRRFLSFFPEGFRDDVYVDSERWYKWEAHRSWVRDLGRAEHAALLSRGAYPEVATRAVRIEARTNLLFSFEKMALRDALVTREGARAFAIGLYEWLYGRGAEEHRFRAWCDVVDALPRRGRRVATWPVVTVFGFLARPRVHVLHKPTVTRAAAEAYGVELRYQPQPGWACYADLLRFARRVRADQADLGPRGHDRRAVVHLGDGLVRVRLSPSAVLPERRSQVAGVLLGLLQQRGERLRDIGERQRGRLVDPLAVALELALLQLEISREGGARVGRGRHVGNPGAGHPAEKVDLSGEGERVVQLLAHVDRQLVEGRQVLGALQRGDVLHVLHNRSVFRLQVLVEQLHKRFAVHRTPFRRRPGSARSRVRITTSRVARRGPRHTRGVQFSPELRDRVADGTITLSFRLWSRPKVKPGGTYRSGAVAIRVDEIELVPFSAVTDDDLVRTGELDREALRRRTAHAGPVDDDTLVYRIEFHVVDGP